MSVNRIPWIQVEKWATQYGLEPDWVAACIMTESSGNQFSARFEPHFKWTYHPRVWAEKMGLTFETEDTCQKMSWGYMQIMGAVARELGFDGHIPELVDTDINLKFGCLKLQQLMQRYGDIHSAIAAYNAGSVRKTPGGFYENQKHVDRFDSWLRKIKDGH